MTPDANRDHAVSLQGDLAVVTIENLMQLMSHADLSGELRLNTTTNAAIFFVRNGALVYGFLRNNPIRIGERLIEAGAITAEHLHECLEIYKSESPRPKIGKILVEKGYLHQEALEEGIREQIRDIFFEVLSWRTGDFAFAVKEMPAGENILLEASIDGLLLQGMMHLDDME